ncbi:MAG TPA: glycosyltransferase family 2 protein [Candidatus Saccharimonadales bacterium]|nr:glycosyltransferase family 2 protein [Candidatus Saccharimonadales bacterium]
MAGEPALSIVIPVLNEAESLPELVARIREALAGAVPAYEVLFVDDGSTDGTAEVLRQLHAEDPRVRALRFRRNYGKSAALAVAFREARGARVVTMDGDLQDEPREVPRLLRKLEEGFDLVSGWKKVRHDPWTKTAPSRLFNLVTSALSGLRLHDFNCGLKAYRSEVTQSLEIYGELHRYLPVLAHFGGFRVTELEVEHHPRQHGQSKFGAARFVNGFLDLLTVLFVTSSRRSPLHLFGRLALLFFVTGALMLAWVVGQWVVQGVVRVRPLLLIGVGLEIVAIQFVSLGLLGELIARHRSPDEYAVRERIG